jgi:hypothetical protein
MPGYAGQSCFYFQFKPRVKQRRVKRMNSRHSGWVLLVCMALALLRTPASAQFSDPRNYQNVPVGVNQIELGYTYVHANASIDSAIVIGGAKLNLNQGTISYTRYFGLFGRTAWVAPGIPLAGLGGSVSGTNVSGSIAGAGDSSYEFAMLFKGGPALSPAEFANYKPTTTLGMSLVVTAPTGLYSGDKILNLGSDRWSFRPEVGVSNPFGPEQKWVLDAYANCYFYTDNTSYRGVEVLKQEPLPGFEGHLSYTFSERVMASLDTRYSFRGETTVNNLGQDDSQRNFILGSEAIVTLNAKNQLTFIFEKALVHVNGPSATGVTLRYDYLWGRGYK